MIKFVRPRSNLRGLSYSIIFKARLLAVSAITTNVRLPYLSKNNQAKLRDYSKRYRKLINIKNLEKRNLEFLDDFQKYKQESFDDGSSLYKLSMKNFKYGSLVSPRPCDMIYTNIEPFFKW